MVEEETAAADSLVKQADQEEIPPESEPLDIRPDAVERAASAVQKKSKKPKSPQKVTSPPGSFAKVRGLGSGILGRC